jgi:thioredoxin reductase
VRKLQLKTTETMGFATVARNETFETSRPGIFAAGDTSIGFMTQTAIAIGDAHKVAIFMVRNELWMI